MDGALGALVDVLAFGGTERTPGDLAQSLAEQRELLPLWLPVAPTLLRLRVRGNCRLSPWQLPGLTQRALSKPGQRGPWAPEPSVGLLLPSHLPGLQARWS